LKGSFSENNKDENIMSLSREQMAQRIAQELKDGYYINLGIGIPTLVANYIPNNIEVCLQSENGLLGIGEYPTLDMLDPDCINAGKESITTIPGASYFSSAESFAMIRGGHIDLTVLGALEVDEQGNIASWMIPGKLVKGMGGAMDLVSGAHTIIVAMLHANKEGKSKLLRQCTLPLTGMHCVHKIITDLAVLVVNNGAFYLQERAPGVSIEEIQAKTEGTLVIPQQVPEMNFRNDL
jgi:3-oxoacid CoA-transferase subunit B